MSFVKQKKTAVLSPPALRQAAELRIAQSRENTPDESPQNKLLHELRVHQVELEMQNEELRRSRLAAEVSLNRYVSLYEFSPVGYLTLTEDGVIAEANLTSSKMLGENPKKLIKQQFSRYITPEDSDRWHLHFNQMVQRGSKNICEVRMQRPDGMQFHARLDCLLLEASNDTLAPAEDLMMRVAISDITAAKQAEQDLRIAATTFKSQEGMMITDAQFEILKVNPAFTSITGYTEQDIAGKTPHLLISGRHDRAFHDAMWAEISSAGVWHDEIWILRKNGKEFPGLLTITAVKDDAGIVSHYVANLTDISARKAAEDEIQRLAFYDPLTHLPNRRLLLDRLHRAIAISARTLRHCALMFIDLDNFKMLNDTKGHDIGDLLLQRVAQRFSICIREGDTVGRMGGDEFVVMLENLSEDPQQAATLAEIIGKKMLSALDQSFRLAGNECAAKASIGITLFNSNRHTLTELLKQADLAMYQAKKDGGNSLRFFSPEMLPENQKEKKKCLTGFQIRPPVTLRPRPQPGK